jgi:hypothetical protein
MTAYADYTYYTNTYLGAVIASPDFARLALRASFEVDRITFNRAAPVVAEAIDTSTIDLIKMATCAVAEQIQTNESEGGVDGISSEQVGSYSVTYSDSSSKRISNLKKVQQAASLYLGQSGLMFSGFISGEYGGVTDED